MAYYDEQGNLIADEGEVPVLPNPAPREVSVEIKDGETDNKAVVDEEGNLQVKVTSMPEITIDTTNLSVEISNDAGNPIPVEIQNQNPIPIYVNDDTDTIPVTVVSQVDVRILQTDNWVRVSNEQFVRNVMVYNEEEQKLEPLPIVVEIKDPVTEVSVSNFPDFPTTIEVSNIPDVQEVSGTILVDDTTPVGVDIKNDSLSVTVSNLSEIVPPTDIKINNGPEDAIPVTGTVTANVEFPATQTISGSVEVSNLSEIVPPTEIKVNNEDSEPIPVKLIDSGALSNEINQYFEQRYSLYNDNAVMYADCAAPQPDPFGRDGFYYTNDGVTGVDHITAENFPTYTPAQLEAAKKKINWYFYDPTRIVAPYSALKNTWALVTVDKSKAPFFFVYSTVNGQTIANRWVFSSYTETLKPGTTYLFWFGTEEPTVFPGVPRIQLAFNPTSSTGPINPAQIILSIAYTTNSGDAVNSVQLQTYALGYNVNNTEQSVKLAIKKSESVVVSGEVTIDSSTPVNVTVSNPTTSVDINSLPEITIADDQSVTITNISFEISNLEDITPPTEIKVNNSASEPVPITGSVTASVEFPATQTISGSVTVSNFSEITPPTEIKVNNTPTEAIPVTGSVEVSNTVAVSGQVTIDSTTPVNVTVSNPVSSVDVSSLPEITIANDQSVTVTNTSFEVSNLSEIVPPTDIKINNGPEDAIPITGTVTANVEFPATQTINGSVTVSNFSEITPPTEIKINNAASEPVPVTINNADPVSVTVSNPVDSVTVSGSVDINSLPEVSATIINTVDEPIPVNVNNIGLYDHPNYGSMPYSAITNILDQETGTGVPINIEGIVEINGGALAVYGAQFDTITGETETEITTTEFYKSVKISNPLRWIWPTGSDRAGWLLNRDKSPEIYGAILDGVEPLHTYTEIAATSPGATPESPLYIAIVGSIDAGTWT